MRKSRFLFIIQVMLVLLTLTTAGLVTEAQSNEDRKDPVNTLRLERLGQEFEELRVLLKIPGMSAAIVKDQRLMWAKGFGFADRENKVAASAETPYPIASLTKTFAATLLMQLVEQGKVNLSFQPPGPTAQDYYDRADDHSLRNRSNRWITLTLGLGGLLLFVLGRTGRISASHFVYFRVLSWIDGPIKPACCLPSAVCCLLFAVCFDIRLWTLDFGLRLDILPGVQSLKIRQRPNA